MADTIESFVAKLQAEGVQAGQDKAKQLEDQARERAEKIDQQAQQKADKIISEANDEAKNILQRARTELELAARDAVLRLRAKLTDALDAVLTRKVSQQIQDPQFLGQLLHDLVVQYAQADSAHKGRIEINVSSETRQELADWALAEMSATKADGGMVVDLKGNLARAGFEYSLGGATVEVTVESVVELLSGMVADALGQTLRKAVAQGAGDQEMKGT